MSFDKNVWERTYANGSISYGTERTKTSSLGLDTDYHGVPDLDDRHVVAAAIHSGAETIVTFNLKDFPAKALSRYNLEAQHPDDFIVDLFDLHPASVLQALSEQRAALKKPPKTADEFLDILLKQGLTQTVSILKDWKVAF